jgi:MOSC domain-containing protein
VTQNEHVVGTLAALWRFPVKSLRAEALTTALVADDGLAGDRRRAMHVVTPGHARSAKTYRGKEHNLLHTMDDPEEARAAAAARGIATKLRDDGPFFDAGAVSVVLDCWVRELEALVGIELDPLRFRPNLYVVSRSGTGNEETYVGSTLVAGGVRLRVVSPIIRCVTPSYDVATGTPEPAIQRALVQGRGNVMGVYCSVEQRGYVALGDEVTASCAPPAPSRA